MKTLFKNKRLSVNLILILILISPHAIAQIANNNDPSFNSGDMGFGYGDGADNMVQTIAIQSDKKILIGGYFKSYNGTPINYIARVNTNGLLDKTFNIGTGPNKDIYAIAIQNDGKILIGGALTSYNGTAGNYITRLNADGTLDGTFNIGTGFDGVVYKIAVQGDGKIIVGGNFTSYNGTTRNYITRLNADGTLDGTFNIGTGASFYVYDMAIQSDGKIIIGGNFVSYNGTTVNRVARLNTDGTLDNTFNSGSGVNGYITTVAIQNDGKIMLGGGFSSYNGTTVNRIIRLNTNGTLDAVFNTGGSGPNDVIRTIAIRSDGKILIGGDFLSYNGISAVRIACLNSNGTRDVTFNAAMSANASINRIVAEDDGKILVGGSFTSHNSPLTDYFACLNSDGILDSTFNGTGANGGVYTTAIQKDGKILIGGYFCIYNATAKFYLARLNLDGTLDGTFNSGSGANAYVSAIVTQNDGKILIGGACTSYKGKPIPHLTRLNADGTIDSTFTPGTGANNEVYAIAVQGDGKIIIGGYFTGYNGTPANYLARLNPNGTLDGTFNIGTGAGFTVKSITIQKDGKIIIAGGFNSFNLTPRRHIARLNTNGTLDLSFNPGTGANGVIINAAAIQSDGKILIGGDFTSYNGKSMNRITRLNGNGSIDTTFNVGTGTNNTIYSLAIQRDGKIIMAGEFTSYNGVSRNRIIRLNPNGTSDNTFNPGIGTNKTINTMAVQSDEKIIIGGEFTSYNGIGRNRIARIFNLSANAPSARICSLGGCTNLIASAKGGLPPYTYSWNTGATTSSINACPTVNTSYTVTVTDGNGITDTAIATIYVGIRPDVNVFDTKICEGDCASLKASGGATYIWPKDMNITTDSTAYTCPWTTTVYPVIGISKDGCADTVNVTVTVFPKPLLFISGTRVISSGSSTTLTVHSSEPLSFYQWDPGNETTQSITVSPTTKTVYTVITGSFYSCITTDTAIVTVLTPTRLEEKANSDDIIKLYPNPFSSQATLSFQTELRGATLKMMDMIGKEVSNIHFSGNQLNIAKGTLKPGIYFIQVFSEENEQIATKKVVIQ